MWNTNSWDFHCETYFILFLIITTHTFANIQLKENFLMVRTFDSGTNYLKSWQCPFPRSLPIGICQGIFNLDFFNEEGFHSFNSVSLQAGKNMRLPAVTHITVSALGCNDLSWFWKAEQNQAWLTRNYQFVGKTGTEIPDWLHILTRHPKEEDLAGI